MGSPKALLPHPSRPQFRLLDVAVELAREFLTWQGLSQQQGDLLLVSGSFEGFPCVSDEVPARGPLGGIHAALKRFRSLGKEAPSHALFVPVDMPSLSLEALSSLSRSVGDAASCCFTGYELPVLLQVSEALEDMLRERLQADSCQGVEKDSRLSLRRLLDDLGGKRVMCGAGLLTALVNINTPSDYQQYEDSREAQ